MVPKDATKFAINLQRGADPEHADLHFHLRASLVGDSPMVARTSRLRGVWGVEERLEGSFPFPVAPKTFLLVLTSYMDSYEVEVNGSSNFSFKVRDGLPVSSVTHLAIEAGLSILSIHIPVENMPRNLRLSLGSGAKVGDMVFIKGEPTPDSKSFVVNWQTGPGKFDDILFQLNPRLEEGRVVHNCRLDDEWGKEESSKEIPLTAGSLFELIVGISSMGFETRLDGKEWLSFRHKQDVGSAVTLFLEGDLQTSNICIDSAPTNPPPSINGIKSRGARLQLFCPELPLTSRVSGGFEKGCLLLLTGRVKAQASSLQLNIQCGESQEDCDVALKYDVKYEVDGSSKITLNSREEDTWGQVVPVKGFEGPLPGRPFDLLIARMDDGFRCFLDGLEHALLPYRLDDQVPDHVSLSGDLETYRLLLL